MGDPEACRVRAVPGPVRHRRAPVRVLRSLRGSVPLRRHPHGHGHPRRAVRLACQQFIFEKDLLMAFTGRDGSQVSGNPRHEPGDPGHPGIDRDKH